MSINDDHVAFTDNRELRTAIEIFTGTDVLAKQDIISKYGDIGEWDVSNVTSMCNMFKNLYYFNADISRWDVSNVTTMYCMFDNCPNFNSDLRRWDVSNVHNMSAMFYDCYNFNSDLSRWDLSKVHDMHHMFQNCPKFLNSINGYRWNKQYWKIVRLMMIKTRAIAFYWLEQSAITSYAPDGAGRQWDMESFIALNQ